MTAHAAPVIYESAAAAKDAHPDLDLGNLVVPPGYKVGVLSEGGRFAAAAIAPEALDDVGAGIVERHLREALERHKREHPTRG